MNPTRIVIIGGEIPDRGELAIQTPASLRALLNLDVRTLTEATSIDRQRREVSVRSPADGTTAVLPYHKLILSPGSSPLRPPLPGIDSPRILANHGFDARSILGGAHHPL